MRILGWILIVGGLSVFALDGYLGDGPNLLWAVPALVGGAIVARTAAKNSASSGETDQDVGNT